MNWRKSGAPSSSGRSLQGLHQLAAAINDLLVAFHKNRLARLGPDRSGLFSHYASLLDQGSLLRPDEIGTAHLILNALPTYDEYAVFRAGLGELAFLLNAAGHDVVACEPNDGRFVALRDGFEHLADAGLLDADRIRLSAEFAAGPAGRTGAAVPRTMLGIATDFAFDLPLEEDARFREALRQLDGLIVCPRLFIRLRQSQAEQRRASEFLGTLGFEEGERFAREQLVHFAQTRRAAAPPAAPSGAAEAPQGPLFDRVMAHVPPYQPPKGKTTWVERRTTEFALASAFGADK